MRYEALLKTTIAYKNIYFKRATHTVVWFLKTKLERI